MLVFENILNSDKHEVLCFVTTSIKKSTKNIYFSPNKDYCPVIAIKIYYNKNELYRICNDILLNIHYTSYCM